MAVSERLGVISRLNSVMCGTFGRLGVISRLYSVMCGTFLDVLVSFVGYVL